MMSACEPMVLNHSETRGLIKLKFGMTVANTSGKIIFYSISITSTVSKFIIHNIH